MPKVGDRRELMDCPLCGGKQWEVYEAHNGYQGQTHHDWERHTHRDPGYCIVHLYSLIKKINKDLYERTDPRLMGGG